MWWLIRTETLATFSRCSINYENLQDCSRKFKINCEELNGVRLPLNASTSTDRLAETEKECF
jgi:hypothetical protein